MQWKPPFLFKNCFFCFSCAASIFPCTFGKSASLVVVIFCTCSWRTSSEVNSLASFSISPGSLSTCSTYFWTSRGKRGCLPYIKYNGLNLVVFDVLVLIANRAPSVYSSQSSSLSSAIFLRVLNISDKIWKQLFYIHHEVKSKRNVLKIG